MRAPFRLSDLIPPELKVDAVTDGVDTITITARAALPGRAWPRCGTASSHIHRRYRRSISDLPCSGRRVELRVIARRFVCTVSHCRQKIFAERFGDKVLVKVAHRTARLESLVHHLGLALGGRPATSFAKRLMSPVSNDTRLLGLRCLGCVRGTRRGHELARLTRLISPAPLARRGRSGSL